MRGAVSGLVGLVVFVVMCTAVHAAEVVVIANNTVAESTVSKKDLARIFFRQKTRWSNGQRSKPVDQKMGSEVREAFCEQMLGRTSKAVESYWTGQVFAGKAAPPPTVDSDQEVLDFVRANPGAVGYISAATERPGVKLLEVN